MLDLIKEALISPSGSFAFVFSFVIISAFIVYMTAVVVTKFGTIKEVHNNLSKIKDDMSIVKAFIEVFKQGSNQFGQSNSPISLTELGVEVERDLHIQRIIDNNWSSLESTISSNLDSDCNPYDVQEVCFKIGRDYSKIISENEFDSIKKYAFNKGYNISEFGLIFGILIRDKFFSILKINKYDVDAHTPPK